MFTRRDTNSFDASSGNGLSAIPDDAYGVVAIHDGVRPFASQRLINEGFELAIKSGNAIAATSLKESLRQVTKDGNIHVSRDAYQLVQTPQIFDIQEIKKAFLTQESELFTDDASVYEASGGKINLYQGDYKNIKITTPDDLIWAEALLKQ